MSDPKYRPRHWSLEPEAFGKAMRIRWKTPTTDAEQVIVLAAQLQHVWSARIRGRARETGMPIKLLATRMGSSYDRVLKLLRGDAVMRIEDVAAAHLALDNIIGAVEILTPTRGAVRVPPGVKSSPRVSS